MWDVGCRHRCGGPMSLFYKEHFYCKKWVPRDYIEKSYICVIRRPCTNLFYVWYCIIQVFFEVTSFCRLLEYYIILGLSFEEFKNCKQNRTIGPEQTNNPMMLRLNSFWYRHYTPFPCTSNRINVVSYTWEQQLQQNSIDRHSN